MRHVHPDLTALCRAVDPAELGGRIRQARIAAGLTQAQVAGEDVSAAYLSRIEAGRRRPDLGLLEKIAARTGVTALEMLLGIDADERAELRTGLDHADMALRSGNAEEAYLRAGEVIERLDGASAADLLPEARYVAAIALEALGEIEDAIADLEQLVVVRDRKGFWIRAGIALTRAHREVGDLDRSIATGESLLATLEELGLGSSEEAIRLKVTIAAAYFEAGDERHAVRICRKAIEEADTLDSPRAQASVYWNTSIIESRHGRVEAAIPLAEQAIGLMEEAQEHTSIAQLRSLLGTFLLRRNPPDAGEAKRVLEAAAEELAGAGASPADLGHNGLGLARAHFLIGNLERAEELIDAVLATYARNAPFVEVSALALRGEIHAGLGRPDETKAAYRQAAATLTAIGADRRAAQLWFELGTLFDQIGDADGAFDAFHRAAASTGLRRASRTTLRSVPKPREGS